MTFKIGDGIIMTADRGKGEGFINYEGTVISVDNDIVTIELGNKTVWYFLLNGTGRGFPGMSIRPAEEKKIEVIKEICPDCGGQIRSYEYNGRYTAGLHICQATTPSQWIEGKAPPVGERIDGVFIGKHGWEKPVYYGIDEIIRIEKYTHWQYVQLPPPPPAKEVEAFGYLEWDKKYDNGEIDYDKACRTEGRAFYSQPVTAEVLNKYFTRKEKEYSLPSSRANNIDEYIAQSKGYGLLFAPVALEELGVK